MNGDDLLTRATRALRDTTEPSTGLDVDANVAATTLARVERSARSAQTTKLRRRTYTRWIVFPMAASFFVFAAWASASGRLTQWVSLATHDDLERPAVSAPIPDPEPEPEPVAVPEPAPEPEPAPSPPPAKKLPAVVPAPADVDALYRAAHDAHFVRRDPAAALAGWDRYLAAAGPGGRFTLEARYNRAISLVRLGRRAEAAAALRPFANGEYGGYRRDEAAQLLRTLE